MLDREVDLGDQLRGEERVTSAGVRVEPDRPAPLEARGEDEPVLDELHGKRPRMTWRRIRARDEQEGRDEKGAHARTLRSRVDAIPVKFA
jgi:hypothetical protein